MISLKLFRNSYLEQTVYADLNFWMNRAGLNDAKRDLTVVEIVYRNSKMAAFLLDLFRTGWKRPH